MCLCMRFSIPLFGSVSLKGVYNHIYIKKMIKNGETAPLILFIILNIPLTLLGSLYHGELANVNLKGQLKT